MIPGRSTITVALLMACAGAVSAGAGEQALEPVVYYVAVNGNDAWSGRLADPNAEGADGPLATVAAARDAVRALRAAGGVAVPVRVQIREGVYVLDEPLRFGPEDSGTHAAPITYEAFPGERPVLSGGRRITGWRRQDHLWVADVPGVGPGPEPFSALWVDGEYRRPARIPNEGYLETGEAVPVVTDPDSGAELQSPHNAFRFQPGDIRPWENLDDVLVVSLYAWDTTRLRFDRIDEENNIAVMKREAGGWKFNHWGPRQRYYIEHVFEGLDQPGEWYLNRKTGTLYYWPMDGEDMASTEVVAPMLQQLVLLEGDVAAGAFVRHLHFQGLRFHHTDYGLGPMGQNSQQASSSVNAAFHARGARHCSLQECEVAHISNYAVWFGIGSQDCLVFKNHLHDLGAGGVRIGEGSSAANEFEVCRHITVDNNWIRDGGKIFEPAVGVWIGRSSFNRVTHNDISDFFYTGISVGWSWGYAPSSANHNVIEYNHIHNIGKYILSDMGGVYLLGDAPGTVLRHNLIHDVFSHSYGGWGIYPDEGSTGLLIENNVVYNTKTGGFHQHYGRENRIVNNIFAFAHEGQIQRTRTEDHISFFFERNIVFFDNGRLLSSNWADDGFRMDFNCYWDAVMGDVDFVGLDLGQWRERGHDPHSIVADPLFEDPYAFNFDLKPESPVFALGFKPIDLSRVGLYGDEEWVSGPASIPREPSKLPAPYTPTLVSDDFEDTAVGTAPRDATLSGIGENAHIRVTDETAAAGNHALKFTDAAGLERSWHPHMFYTPHIRRGHAVGAFSLRMEADALLYHEWRTAGGDYRVGPSIRIRGDGRMSASGNELMSLALGEWYRIQIDCALGADSTGSYAVTVTPRGGEPRRFDDIPFVHDSFRILRWYGFVADGVVDAVFYLDDVQLDVR